MAIIMNQSGGGNNLPSNFGVISTGSNASYTADRDIVVGVFLDGYANPASGTITTDGTFLAGVYNGNAVNSFTSPLTVSPTVLGGCWVFKLNAGESVSASCTNGATILELNCSDAENVNYSYEATKDEYIISGYYSWDNNNHNVAASNKRVYTVASGRISYKPTSNFTVNNSAPVCIYLLSNGDTLPSSEVTASAIKLK